VKRAFVATGAEGAVDTFSRVRGRLDAWGRSWVAMRTDACLATRVRGEQSDEALDLRMACLQAGFKELGATVDMLARADASVVENAVQAAAGLPRIEACADVAALRAPYARPRDAAQARAVDDVRKGLAGVAALDRAGQAADALPLVTSLVDRAAQAGYEPAHAEALWRKGATELELDRADEAGRTLLDAALEAEAARDDEVAAQSWVSLVRVAARKFAPADCERDARFADAAIRRLRDPDLPRADLLDARSRCAYDFGDDAPAVGFSKDAIAIYQRALGADHPTTLMARVELADSMWNLGAIEDAMVIYADAETALARVLGPQHPQTVRCVKARGESLIELGDYASALEVLGRVRAMMGARTPAYRLAYLSAVTGEARMGSGRIEEGIAELESAVPTFVAERGGARSVFMGEIYGEVARTIAQRSPGAEAEAYADKAVAILLEQSARTGRLATAYGARALCRARRGDARGAIEDADAALAAKDPYLGERSRIAPLLARGQARLSTGDAAGATADLERAAALGEKFRGDAVVRAEVRLALARALVETGADPTRAADLAGRAASELDSAGLPDRAAAARAIAPRGRGQP
jgi:tetratricopeptide (TPR) repeat protein